MAEPLTTNTFDVTRQSERLAWRAGRVGTNGIQMAFEEIGDEQDDAIVLITGLSWQLIHWPDSFCQQLARQGFRVIRIDNRDAGLSTQVDGRVRFNLIKSTLRRKVGLACKTDYSLYDMSNDVIGLLDALSIKRAHLVGVSMGGMISQITAGQAPDRVASLTSIMSTTNHPWLPGAKRPVLAHMMNKPKDTSRDTIIERTLTFQRLIGSPRYPTPEADIRALAGQAYDRAFRPGGVLRQTHAIVATGSFEPVLRHIKAPTQIIHGDADPLVPLAGGKRSAKRIKQAGLTIIEGMGHDLPAQLLPQLAELTLANIARV